MQNMQRNDFKENITKLAFFVSQVYNRDSSLISIADATLCKSLSSLSYVVLDSDLFSSVVNIGKLW